MKTSITWRRSRRWRRNCSRCPDCPGHRILEARHHRITSRWIAVNAAQVFRSSCSALISFYKEFTLFIKETISKIIFFFTLKFEINSPCCAEAVGRTSRGASQVLTSTNGACTASISKLRAITCTYHYVTAKSPGAARKVINQKREETIFL